MLTLTYNWVSSVIIKNAIIFNIMIDQPYCQKTFYEDVYICPPESSNDGPGWINGKGC
jgi:hypothetical protein